MIRLKASAPSSLNFGVEPLQFHAGVLDAELPATPILSLEGALGYVQVPFFKVCEQHRAFLARSRLAHDLAAFNGLLLALRHAGMTIRPQVLDGKWAIMVHMRIKRQHQRWTLPHDPHAGVTMAMDTAFVAFWTLEPTLQVHIVGGKISRLASHKQPRLTAAHHLGEMLLNGVGACLPRLLQRDEPRLPLLS